MQRGLSAFLAYIHDPQLPTKAGVMTKTETETSKLTVPVLHYGVAVVISAVEILLLNLHAH